MWLFSLCWTTLPSLNKFPIVMSCNFLICYWISFASILLRIFTSVFMRFWSVFFFSCDAFVWLWYKYQANAGVFQWVRMCPFLFHFFKSLNPLQYLLLERGGMQPHFHRKNKHTNSKPKERLILVSHVKTTCSAISFKKEGGTLEGLRGGWWPWSTVACGGTTWRWRDRQGQLV